MSRRLILRPEAEAEMTGAFDWYEQRLPGLGSEPDRRGSAERHFTPCTGLPLLSCFLRDPVAPHPARHKG
jgi:hypothetical protein